MGFGPIRAIEFYAGIGGLHLALERSGLDAGIVEAYDWDPAASQVYAYNWGNKVKKVDIASLTAAKLAPLNASLWLMSPACQPYTILNPSARGAADPRARSFLHLVEKVLPDLAKNNEHPRWILVENVAGFETSTTRRTLIETLQSLGYVVEEFLLTPLQFSIPNSRMRYYLLAKLRPHSSNPSQTAAGDFHIRRSIPGHGADWVDPRTRGDDPSGVLYPELRHFLDDPKRAQDPDYWHAYTVPDKVLQKKGFLFDIVLPSSTRTCCFTRGYTHMVEGTSILQMNESLDTTATFNAYAAAPEEMPNRLQMLHALRLRYFTPEELLRLFYFLPAEGESFPGQWNTFRWPDGISQKTKYRLIGNSVNVKVVQKLITYLLLDMTVVHGIRNVNTRPM